MSTSPISLRNPVPDGRFTDPYGWRGAVYGAGGHLIVPPQLHTGQDIAAPEGTVIRAAHAGRVSSIWWDSERGVPMGGNMLRLTTENGYSTRYAHLSAYAVSTGDWVHAGDPIGYVGSTGAATGPHLHFELQTPAGYIDPAPYITDPGTAETPEPETPEEDDMSTIYARPTSNSSPTKKDDPSSARVWAGDDREYFGTKYSGVWAVDTETGNSRRLTMAEWRVVEAAYAATGRPVPLAQPNGNDVETLLYAPKKPGI